MVERICKLCGKNFMTYPSEINKGKGKNCSRRCADISKRTKKKKNCKNCGKFFIARGTQLAIGQGVFCSHSCKFTGKWNSNWVGGRVKSNGYVAVRDGKNKYKYEHRLIIEKLIRRKLKSDEVVHHKNHNKLDNRISNLQVMTMADHARHHAAERAEDKANNAA